MTPKEKALELVDNMFNTENCGIEHFPSKRYCDCSEINMYQAQQCALIAVDEMLNFQDGLFITEGSLAYSYWQDVKKEIEKL